MEDEIMNDDISIGLGTDQYDDRMTSSGNCIANNSLSAASTTQRDEIRNAIGREDPRPMEADLTPRGHKYEINIRQLDYGFVANVGCQSFAVETPEKLLENLGAYFKDPVGFEKNWMRKRELAK